MTRRFFQLFLVVSLVLAPAFLGCDSGGSGEDEGSSLSGTWSGETVENGVIVPITLTLSESTGQVTGEGMYGEAPGEALSVNGTYTYPDVALTLSFDDEPRTLNLTATVSPNRMQMDGQLREPGASAALPITLQK